MGHLSKSLASLIEDLREPHGRMQTLENRPGPGDRGELQTLESHGGRQSPHSTSNPEQHGSHEPAHDEVLNYLGRLADDYHLPRKLVYAVADAESSVNAGILPQPNYQTKHGKRVVTIWDYGLMQLNSKSRIGETHKDPDGQRFKITEDVKRDWKANARGAVAILAEEYGVAEMEQGPGATAEDRAQQTYSAYTHGHRKRDLYLKARRDGLPSTGKDRNFLLKYRQWPDR